MITLEDETQEAQLHRRLRLQTCDNISIFAIWSGFGTHSNFIIDLSFFLYKYIFYLQVNKFEWKIYTQGKSSSLMILEPWCDPSADLYQHLVFTLR